MGRGLLEAVACLRHVPARLDFSRNVRVSCIMCCFSGYVFLHFWSLRIRTSNSGSRVPEGYVLCFHTVCCQCLYLLVVNWSDLGGKRWMQKRLITCNTMLESYNIYIYIYIYLCVCVCVCVCVVCRRGSIQRSSFSSGIIFLLAAF